MNSIHMPTQSADPTGAAIRSFTADDVTLAYRPLGQPAADRTPVLFIHGLSYFSWDWVSFGASLCTDRPGCAMDMRGFGDSSNSPGGDYSVPTMSRDIGALLDHLQWRRVIIVAHSMGGRSATYFTATHPDRVAALVLVDWSPDNAPAGSRRVAQTVANTPEVFEDLAALMRYFGEDSDSPNGADRKARFEAYSRVVPGGLAIKRDPHFRQQFKRQLETGEKAQHGADLWKAVGDVQVPTLVLRGTRSDLFAVETLPKVLATNPRFQAVEVEAGHHVAGDNPDAALKAIRQFINEENI